VSPQLLEKLRPCFNLLVKDEFFSLVAKVVRGDTALAGLWGWRALIPWAYASISSANAHGYLDIAPSEQTNERSRSNAQINKLLRIILHEISRCARNDCPLMKIG